MEELKELVEKFYEGRITEVKRNFFRFQKEVIVKRINERKIQAEEEMKKFSEEEIEKAKELYNLLSDFDYWEIVRFFKKIERSKDDNLKKWTYYKDLSSEIFC